MRASARSLSETPAQDVVKLGSKIQADLDAAGTTPESSTFISLMAAATQLWPEVGDGVKG